MSLPDRKAQLDRGHSVVSIRRQCRPKELKQMLRFAVSCLQLKAGRVCLRT
jgi:hypothetical protein